MRKRIAILLVALSASCASADFKHAGAAPGALQPDETETLLASLRTMPRFDPSAGVLPDKGVAPMNPMTLYFGSAADGNLIDLVYLVEATQDFEQATIRASMIHREDRPDVLAEQQNLWVVAFVATRRHQDAGNCRFSLHLLHESIAPVPSPAEQGIVAAVAALVKVETKRPELKSTDVSVDFRFQSGSCPARPAEGSRNADRDDKGEGGTVPVESLRLLGTTADVALYAGIRKLSLSPGTTNRIVLNPVLRAAEGQVGPVAGPRTRGVTVTFRDASRPSLRATLGLGVRVDFKERPKVNGVTRSWSPYDPDLYLLGHWIPPFSARWQLEAEWYPSIFLGTNLVTRSPLTDLVLGVRVPVYLIKGGVAAGVSWGKYEFKVDPACAKGKDCETDSTRKAAGFLAADYEF